MTLYCHSLHVMWVEIFEIPCVGVQLRLAAYVVAKMCHSMFAVLYQLIETKTRLLPYRLLCAAR